MSAPKKYLAKASAVEAMKYDGPFDMDFLWDDDSVSKVEYSDSLVIRSKGEETTVHLGGWVVNIEGRYTVFNDAEFEARYVEVVPND